MGILRTKYGITGILSIVLCIILFQLLDFNGKILASLLAILTAIDLALIVYFNEPEE